MGKRALQKPANLLSSVAFLVLICVTLFDDNPVLAADCRTSSPGPNEDIFTVDGKRVKVVDGDAYVCRRGRWEFEKTLIRKGFENVRIKKTSQRCEMVDESTGKTLPLARQFSTGFEASSFLDLFGPEQWSVTTLLSPKADSVKEYMQLNRRIMKGGDFLDNRIDLVTDNVHSGRQALRFFSVAPGFGMRTSKALVEKKNLCFAKGDHLWFSGWFFVEKGMPSTLLDFETRRMASGPGIRLFLRNKKYASMELKFAHKPQYNQKSMQFPTRKWVHIKVHLYLSNRDDGLVEIWQDGNKILTTQGQTLPTYDTVYHAMQVGITATSQETALIVDDVSVSTSPL